jgi:long-chain acyl-CoA synthetase
MWQLSESLTAHADRRTIYVRRSHDALTYADAVDSSRAGAERLAASGVRGANVALVTANSFDGIVGYWTLLRSGAVPVMVDPQATAPELLRTVETCDCEWIACDARHRPLAAAAAAGSGSGVIVSEGLRTSVDVCPSVARAPARRPANVAVMCASSGSSGASKAVMLSHANLEANVDAHVRSLGLGPGDSTLVVLPLAFSYAHTTQLLAHTKLGGTIVLYDEPVFGPRHFAALVEQWRPTVTSLVPPLLVMLDGYRYLDRHDLGSLRYLCCGGAPLPLDAARSLMHKLPRTRFVHTYGLTEASPRVTTLGPADRLEKLPSIGKPIAGVTVRILREDGRPAGRGEIGELTVEGPNVMVGYYAAAAGQADTFLDGGRLHTGDLAFEDGDGYLYVVGRKKHVIISGGVNLCPEEVEQVLCTHPAVSEAVVRGEADVALGEVPVADVALRSDAALSLAELHAFLSDRLAPWKWPRRLYVEGALPKTHSGKPRRARVH